MSASDSAGLSSPLGATMWRGRGGRGVNFSLFSRHAAEVDLLLFNHEDDVTPARSIPLTRTSNYWHTFVPELKPGQLYAYRVDGPNNPATGMRFDKTKALLDPYGLGVAVPAGYRRNESEVAMKSVVVDPSAYDWEDDRPPRHSSARSIIYEMHVRGFTRHPSSGVAENLRGTYAGLIEKIPHLQELGITAVELLPVFAFDAQDAPVGKVNYWGYQPVSFFAPLPAYSSRVGPNGAVDEFRDMVKALHRAGIEVILDVVFNHTAEDDHSGPTFSFRGIDNPTYYILENDDRSRYANFSGTGNTLNANHPVVRRMILDSLRYWVREMHVDGFRFDLASILSRDQWGRVLPNPPVLWDIDSDPALAGTKIIAEAWDAAGLNQVGKFVGDNWKEWNGHFRDDARAFFRGEANGAMSRFVDRFIGSPAIYGHKRREPEQSVNFVTCHDGFALNDLVSYDRKHNDSNGEENRDGSDDNKSWNCGTEGPSDDPAIETLRNRQVKNFFTVTMLSLGVPMMLMGDEMRRTQNGNNNAYCRDDEGNWLDWSLLEKHRDVHRFVSLLNARRLLRDIAHEQERLSLNEIIAQATKSWHGVKLNQPDWGADSHSIALTVEMRREMLQVHIILNAFWEPLTFELPPTESTWLRWIDTSLPSPDDITDWKLASVVAGESYRVASRSVVVLIEKGDRHD